MKFYVTYLLLILCLSGVAQQNTIPVHTPEYKFHSYTFNSVLKSGTWIKLKVKADKVYKITYNDLVSYGIDPSLINPQNIRIFGNGGGILPESNADANYDDLIENAIYVYGEADGHFNPGDYILFYGQSPVKWTYDSLKHIFYHSINYYSDETDYFMTYDQGAGKRIQLQNSSTDSPNYTATKFNDYFYHEKDTVNLLGSGKEWYGEYFNAVNTYNFNYNFPGIDMTSRSILRINIAAKGLNNTVFNIHTQNSNDSITVAAISGSYTADYAKYTEDTISFYPTDPDINITITNTTQGSVGWLNFIDINTVRNLGFYGHQMNFRSTSSLGNGKVTEFRMSNADSLLTIWDVTDPFNIRDQRYTLNGTVLSYRAPMDSLRQYIVFDGTDYSTPEFAGNVPNQNLHGIEKSDMIIIAYPDFLTQANRLANIHVDHDNFSVTVVTPQEIYNEFSSGTQDIGAIRNFVRMIYGRSDSSNRNPRYLLLFGNGSYDYKNHFSQNSSLIPSYESFNSLLPTATFVTDDFFGLMDATEGYSANGGLDVSIGRLPARNAEEAKVLVDKIQSYLTKKYSFTELNGCTYYTKEISGDWRNIVCFVADDEDNNLHISQADEIASTLDTANKLFNVKKIYLDAYVQSTGSSGASYPDVTKAINKQVEDGALVINYTGHGGQTGWADENVLQISDINNWTNISNLPVFVTATCEFSPFDDPMRTSAGELILLNPKGGGIALFTTTRVTFSNSNFSLNKSFSKYAFKKFNGDYLRMGDIIRFSKIENGSIVNIRNFLLLGDPALKLDFPENNVATTFINGQPATAIVGDTLSALSKVTISGIIQNSSGTKLSNFNGYVYPTVFDKKTLSTTLANDPTSSHFNFYQRNKILFKGKTTVTNGNFTFSFFLPKDMNDGIGKGKISYFAHDSLNDASGFYDGPDFILGGKDSTVIPDNGGPFIRLFMKDTSFISGGTTDPNPLLIALLADSTGINANDISFGHDITAVLDDNTEESIVLNEYYNVDANSYKSGDVVYPFTNLSEGLHTLRLKAWNILDRSVEATTDFNVSMSNMLSIKNVFNYPNPFKDFTRFYFEHNQPCCDLDVEIKIFTVTGELIKTISQTVQSTGTTINSISWDGRSDGGYKLNSGIYVYHILVKTDSGTYLESYNKLIILR